MSDLTDRIRNVERPLEEAARHARGEAEHANKLLDRIDSLVWDKDLDDATIVAKVAEVLAGREA